jgi:DNA polymerase III, delta subunit
MEMLFSKELASRQPVATRLLSNGVLMGRMAHAFLLTGRAEADKWSIARELAQFLNCSKEDKFESGACLIGLGFGDGRSQPEPLPVAVEARACQNCRWLFRDEHPKAWMVLSSEASKSGKIPVEAARNLSEELARTSNYVRVVIIEEANEGSFHRPAANALLKTIEEPRSNCLFLLFSQTQDGVLATIVSRCQVVPLNNRIEENLGILAQLKDGRNISTLSRHPENLEIYDKLKGEGFLHGFHADKHRPDSREALALAQTLQGLLEEDYSADQVLDVALTMELQALKTVSGASASAYLATLMRLCEEAKRQIDQYVSKKAVCESFVLSWLKLRQNFNNQ